MMLSCIAVAVLSLAASSAEGHQPWWRTAVFYQIYPRSFKDGTGDGVGDLKGITQMAPYFKEIGVDAVWLNPINMSPMKDFGYDISDFTKIDPLFGTLEDFHNMVEAFKKQGIKVVFDFVPNHTSDQHVWFQASADPSHPLHEDYKDFYVWLPANGTASDGTPIPPNNWICVFEGSLWEWSESRKMFYLHHFVKEQPDLNYRNPNVVSNMTAIINFWLDEGVDGLRMDAPKFLYENGSFPNELPVTGTSGGTYDTMQHNYDENQPETFELMSYWSDVVLQRVMDDGRERALFVEVYEKLDWAMKYYGTGNHSMQIEFHFRLMNDSSLSSRPNDIKRLIDEWMDALPEGAVPNWVMGNHDNKRLANRFGPEMTDAINMLTGTLPGVMCVYYGEEIGMEDTFILWNQTVDPRGILQGPDDYLKVTRDPERTPMQWDNSTSAGFSTNKATWLPVNPNYWWLNVAAQRAAPVSHLKVFQAMTAARKHPVLQRGDLNVLLPDENTLLVIRSYNGSHFVLIINMGRDVTTYTSENLFSPSGVDVNLTVVVTSLNFVYTPGFSTREGCLNVTLRPKAAILLRSGTSQTMTSAGTPALASTVQFLLGALLICVLPSILS